MIDKPERRRFPPLWSVDDPDTKELGQDFVRDANGQALGYAYFEETRGGCAAPKPLP
jgi:hypothetical protein